MAPIIIKINQLLAPYKEIGGDEYYKQLVSFRDDLYFNYSQEISDVIYDNFSKELSHVL
jgi:hypothetical protein